MEKEKRDERNIGKGVILQWVFLWVNFGGPDDPFAIPQQPKW